MILSSVPRQHKSECWKNKRALRKREKVWENVGNQCKLPPFGNPLNSQDHNQTCFRDLQKFLPTSKSLHQPAAQPIYATLASFRLMGVISRSGYKVSLIHWENVSNNFDLWHNNRLLGHLTLILTVFLDFLSKVQKCLSPSCTFKNRGLHGSRCYSIHTCETC